MRILFITAWYPNKNNSAAGVFVREHAKAVYMSGDDVVVMYAEKAKAPFKGLYKIIETIEEGIRTIRISYFPTPFRFFNYLVYLGSILQASWKLKRMGFNPEVIHAHIYVAGVPAALVSKIFRIPMVVTEHSTEFPRKKLTGLKILQAKFAFKWAKIILPVSISLQQAIQEYGIKARFEVVPNVVDTRVFYFSPCARKENQVKRLLVVSLLDISHKKGIPHLLTALTLLRQSREDWYLDIIGDGPARAEYERLTLNLGINDKITFHGVKSKKEVAEFMRRADFLVLPSLFETFSVVTAEALTSGIPVLATRCGGPEEFVTKDVGLLVPPGNTEALFNGLNYMLDHLEMFNHNQISHYAAKNFSPERVGEQIHRVYLECITKYKGFYGTTIKARQY